MTGVVGRQEVYQGLRVSIVPSESTVGVYPTDVYSAVRLLDMALEWPFTVLSLI